MSELGHLLIEMTVTACLKAAGLDIMSESISSGRVLGTETGRFLAVRHNRCSCHSFDQLCSLALLFDNHDDEEDEVPDVDGAAGITCPWINCRGKGSYLN
jgi:hypothetical protein